jgi:cell division septation protein DedD
MPAMRIPALCLLLVTGPLAAQDAPAVTTLRVAPPASVVSGKKTAALLPAKPLAAGERVRTGTGGRASFQLSGGVLTLGGDSELYLHSTAAGESADIGRVVLTRGALRVQVARDTDLTPLDLRLNLGPLRLRAVGANIWVATEPRGETACLLAGSIDIEAEFGTETLDRPGDCLFFSAQNRRMVLRPDTSDTLARKLERTAFAADLVNGRASVNVVTGPQGQPGLDDGDADAPGMIQPAPAPVPVDATPTSGFVIVSEPEPVALPAPAPAPEPEPVPEPAPPAAAAAAVAGIELAPAPEYVEPLPETPPPQAAPESPIALAALPEPGAEPAPETAPSSPAGETVPALTSTEAWYVVVASPGAGEAASAYAKRLRAQGVEAAVRTGGGRQRVVVGPFGSRSAAAEARAQLQYQLKISDAWLLQD